MVVTHHRMFGDVAHPADHLVPGQQGQQPQDKVRPPHTGCGRDREDGQVAEKEVLFYGHQFFQALPRARVRAHFCAEKFHAPLITGDAQNVAPHLAPKALTGDGKRGRQNQVGVFGLLGVTMVAQVIGPVKREACPHRPAAQKGTQRVIEAGVLEQGAVRRIVHQYGQAQLPAADDDHGDDEAQGVGPGHKKRHGQRNHAPGMQHQISAHPVRAFAQIGVLLGGQDGLGFDVHGNDRGQRSHLLSFGTSK